MAHSLNAAMGIVSRIELRRLRPTRVAAGVAVLALAGGVLGTAAVATTPSPAVQRELDKVVSATKRYREVGVALRDGYTASAHCEQRPGAGAMGFHYYNPKLGSDPRLDPLHPEFLLYMPTASGGRRLAGVEYYRRDADQDKGTDGDRPRLFRHWFNGPMDGHFPGQPIHYDLHVWLFLKNPKGVFARYNPAGHC